MTKTVTHGNTTFHPEVKGYYPPVIVDSFIDDDGENNFVLANGNTTLETRYNSLWKPNKGIVNWKAKGKQLDHRQIR